MTPDTAPGRYPLKLLRRQLRSTLAQVEHHRRRIVITRRGKPIAAVVPIDDYSLLTTMNTVLNCGVDRVMRAYAIEDAVRKLCDQFFPSERGPETD
jgi:prevent-host-death family protein